MIKISVSSYILFFKGRFTFLNYCCQGEFFLFLGYREVVQVNT
jgi:hypothetical protein